jgi:hypothetical protein
MPGGSPSEHARIARLHIADQLLRDLDCHVGGASRGDATGVAGGIASILQDIRSNSRRSVTAKGLAALGALSGLRLSKSVGFVELGVVPAD